MRRVTDALKELDTFLTFEFFKFSVLLDEVLLVHRQFDTLEVVQDRRLSISVSI